MQIIENENENQILVFSSLNQKASIRYLDLDLNVMKDYSYPFESFKICQIMFIQIDSFYLFLRDDTQSQMMIFSSDQSVQKHEIPQIYIKIYSLHQNNLSSYFLLITNDFKLSQLRLDFTFTEVISQTPIYESQPLVSLSQS